MRRMSGPVRRFYPRQRGMGELPPGDPNTFPSEPQFNDDVIFNPPAGGGGGLPFALPGASGPSGAPSLPQAVSAVEYPQVIADTSVKVLEENRRRVGLVIQNKSTTANLYYAFGQVASSVVGVKLGPGGGFYYEYRCPIGSLHLVFDSVSAQLAVVEEITLLS